MSACHSKYKAAKTIVHNWGSLLLATSSSLLFPLARDDLPKHDDTVAIHESNSRQALAILEGIAHKWLLRLEAALSHLVGLQRMRVLHLLTTRFLAHFPFPH